jgi:glycosyltransferase involved in cell wall biosynthesis
MHHRLPVVAFGAAAVPETLGDAGLLLSDKSPALVGTAVQRVLTDSALRVALQARAEVRLTQFSLARAQARFTEAITPILELL